MMVCRGGDDYSSNDFKCLFIYLAFAFLTWVSFVDGVFLCILLRG